MTAQPLSVQEQAASGFTHKFTLKAADDFVAADTGTTKSIALTAVPAGTTVRSAGFRLVTPFDASDAAINSVTVQVGETDTDRFLPATQVAVDGTEILYFQTANVTDTLPWSFVANDTIDILFTVAGGASPTIAELNAGEIEIYLGLFNLNSLGDAKA